MAPDTPDRSRSLSERVGEIERLLDEVPDERALAESIEKMGISAQQLAAALTSVEKSQRELVLLKRRTASLEDKKADNEEVKEMREKHRRDILRMRGWVFSAAIMAVALLGTTVFAFSMYNKEKTEATIAYQKSVLSICRQREEQSAGVRKYLDLAAEDIAQGESSGIPADRIARAKQQLDILRNAFPSIDCNQLRSR